jgi:hypothetical protein
MIVRLAFSRALRVCSSNSNIQGNSRMNTITTLKMGYLDDFFD